MFSRKSKQNTRDFGSIGTSMRFDSPFALPGAGFRADYLTDDPL
jgi:hypothetical protein